MADGIPAIEGRVTQSRNPLNGQDDNWRPLGDIAAELVKASLERQKQRPKE